ncbi:acyl-CoA dehydrogenase family protein [Ruegeria sp. R14_0]|uniref:acyl-CoA dehydrogenase family protein n=1 Tax=Ruegeria sp. R14_0 TaxID=2821100 RepID=UPI001ADBD52B|nr:acyl-CoA dehydrogenase family protein [Ruegeria sp. R14_0]
MDQKTRHNDRDRSGDVRIFAETIRDTSPDTLRDLWKSAGKNGVFRHLVPSADGGSGDNARALVEDMLTFGAHCLDGGFGMAVLSQILTIQKPLLRFASPEARQHYIPRLLAGDLIGAFALTEPSSGSDALSLTTTATPKDGGYVLNGHKAFVGMGPICDFAIVFAQTAPDKGRWGLSAFIVHSDDSGFFRRDRQEKLGLNTSPIGELEFRDCWIPETRRIGPEGAGATIIQTTLDWERCFILTAHVGAMRRQLAECVEFAASRHQFGKPISAFQSVSNRLADMRVRLETCELMLARAAQLYDSGQPLSQFAAMANLHIAEAYLSSSLDAMRTFGGRGYLKGSNAGADVTDALGGVIYSGTSDIQREIIAKMELGQRSQPNKVGDGTNGSN